MAIVQPASADPLTAPLNRSLNGSLHRPIHGLPPMAAGPEPVSREELNAWRRGFTPQAEIWNGRLAMLGLSVGLTVLLLARLAS